ncbi:MAG: META domain-containing protein [Solirubrobacterales bacterium]
MSRQNHIRTFLILVAVAALGVIVGCGDSGSESGGSETTDDTASRMEPMAPEDLSGRTFVSTGVKGRSLVAGTQITLGFDSGMLSASAGCNSIQGKYEINGDSFSLGKAAETLLGCPKELEDQDEWLTSVLQSGLRPYERGDTVVFLGLGVEIDAKESDGPASAPPVVGTDWLLNSYSDKQGNVVSMKPGVRLPFLEFKADDTVFVFDGCNTGNGRAVVQENGTITFGPIGLTRIACPGLSGDVSNAFLKVINGKTDYDFEAQNLVITKQGNSLSFNAGE